jgi:hypothetical protein
LERGLKGSGGRVWRSAFEATRPYQYFSGYVPACQPCGVLLVCSICFAEGEEITAATHKSKAQQADLLSGF